MSKPPEDQVPRQLAYEAAHEGKFTPACKHDPMFWWESADGFKAGALSLGALMDRLERLDEAAAVSGGQSPA